MPATLLVCLVLVVTGLTVPLPEWGRGFRALADLWHAPAFAVIAWLACRSVPRRPSMRRSYGGIWVTTMLLGAGSELFQHWAGRSASLHDLIADLVGATVGVSLAIASRSWLGWSLSVAAVLVVSAWPLATLADVVYQRQQMPHLATFERPLEMLRWQGDSAAAQRYRLAEPQEAWVLRVAMRPDRYPGVTFLHPSPNWLGYRYLSFEVTSISDEPFPLILKIVDQDHNNETNDRFHHSQSIRPGWERIRIPLDKVQRAPSGREMDLARIKYLQLFSPRLAKPTVFYLDNVRLEKN